MNELARAGLVARAEPVRFRQRTHSLHARIDVTNVAEAVESLDGPTTP